MYWSGNTIGLHCQARKEQSVSINQRPCKMSGTKEEKIEQILPR
jgi:hypothetical protein